MSDEFVKWMQSRLTSHGFACGGIDGELGPVTVAALKVFQAKSRLPATGVADAATVTALRATSATVPAVVKMSIPDRDAVDKVETFTNGSRIWPRQKDCESYFGAVGTNQVTVPIPYEMRVAWGDMPVVRKMTLHKLVAPSATRVMEKVAARFNAAERAALGIDKFGGALNVRRMRGGSAWSMHAWGIAIDFDPARNALNVRKPNARLSRDDASEFWALWESEGWLSLGRARDFDYMHVQAARL